MTSAPILDTAFGLRCVAGNEMLYRKLLATFMTQQGNVVAAVQQALNEGDAGQAHALIHTLKGVSASLGLIRLSETARDMDARFKAGGDMTPLLPRLAEHLNETLQRVAVFLRPEA